MNRHQLFPACIPRSFETYDELRTFVHGERGAMGGTKGSHDDRVMALLLANIAARQSAVGRHSVRLDMVDKSRPIGLPPR